MHKESDSYDVRLRIAISLFLILGFDVGWANSSACGLSARSSISDIQDVDEFLKAARRLRVERSEVADLKQMPWVGLLEVKGVGGCTGTLVAPDIVVTSAHCFPEGATGKVEFRLGENGRESREIIEGRLEKIGNANSRASDWALVRLDRGAKTVSDFPDFYNGPLLSLTGRPLSLVGYANDDEIGRDGNTPYADHKCNLWGRHGALRDTHFTTDCYASAGSSGGPVLVKNGSRFQLVGIHSRVDWFSIGSIGTINTAASQAAPAFRDMRKKK